MSEPAHANDENLHLETAPADLAVSELDLHRLLAMETDGGDNAYCQASGSDLEGYLATVSRAWQRATLEFERDKARRAIGLECRYALITASWTSIAARLGPNLLAALVDRGVWTPAQALAVARQTPRPWWRVELLARLAPNLPTELLPAVAATLRATHSREMGFAGHRADALAELIPQLAVAGHHQAALEAVRDIDDERRGRVLAELVPHLPQEMTGIVLVLLRGIDDDRSRAQAIAGLLPCLPPPLAERLADGAAGFASSGANPYACHDAFDLVAPRLAEIGQANRALELARDVEDAGRRAAALAGVARHLSTPERTTVLAEAEEAMRAAASGQAQRGAWLDLASVLAEVGDVERAIALGREIDLGSLAVEPWLVLAQRVSQGQRLPIVREALAAVAQAGTNYYPTTALTVLLSLVPAALIPEARAVAQAIPDTERRAAALTALVPRLSDPEREEVVDKALAAARALDDEPARLKALVALVPHLPLEEQEKILRSAVVRVTGGDYSYRQVLDGLAIDLPAPLQREALDAVRAMDSDYEQERILEALGPHLSSAMLREAITLLVSIGDEEARAAALETLNAYLPRRRPLEALLATRGLENTADRRNALADLAPQLAALGYLEQAVAAVRDVEAGAWQAEALAALSEFLPEPDESGPPGEATAAASQVVHLPEESGVEAWQETLAELMDLPEVDTSGIYVRGPNLLAAAPDLPGFSPEVVLAAARALPEQHRMDLSPRIPALVALAHHLPETARGKLLREALAIAQSLSQRSRYISSPREKTLAELAADVAALGFPEMAVAAVLTLEDGRYVQEALAGLVPHLAGLPVSQLHPLWSELLAWLATRTRAELLAALCILAPLLAALGGEAGVAEASAAIEDVGRWWP